MIGLILGFLLKLLGPNVVGDVLGYFQKKSDNETVRYQAQQITQQNNANNAASVVVAGMSHRWFWIPWLMATMPLTMWFGWGMLDSTIAAGQLLPNVAALPPQLLQFAQIAWGNLFYAGAAAAILGRK